MHIHILGICGTFMGGIAALARAAGHRVTGCDQNVYPPMSTQLEALDIDLIEGWDSAQLGLKPDVFLIGNVVSRGNPLMEAILDAGLPYTSGPQWLAEHVLRGRRVIAVAGTHGKTTTASLVSHLLEAGGQAPGFLIGGVPGNFDVSARLGSAAPFVVEADEYDTAFFDKRSKFVHYRPNIAVLNNLEFDHADIFADLDAIKWQFHQLMRTVPGNGRVVVNADDENLRDVLASGCWTPVSRFLAPADDGAAADVVASFADKDTSVRVAVNGRWHEAPWTMRGAHNLQNTAAAIAACIAAGIEAEKLLAALGDFRGVKRRLECIAEHAGIRVFDDFAHHPTAIRLTVEAMLRGAPEGRLLVAFEPRSNTMRMGVHARLLPAAFTGVDALFVLAPRDGDWDVPGAFEGTVPAARVFDDAAKMRREINAALMPGDRLVMMSNGGFSGLRESLADDVRARQAST